MTELETIFQINYLYVLINLKKLLKCNKAALKVRISLFLKNGADIVLEKAET